MSWMRMVHLILLIIWKKMTNNMEQTFGKDKHFHVHIMTIKLIMAKPKKIKIIMKIITMIKLIMVQLTIFE